MIKIDDGKNILMENIHFVRPPYWTTSMNVDGMEIRHCEIDARRTSFDSHDLVDITAFNTDGFDVSGKNVWIHHCKVWN